MDEAGSALVLDCDATLITPRVGCSGRVELINDRVFCGDYGVDVNVVVLELESVFQVWDVVVTDADLAAYGHRRPALHRAAG